MKIRREPFYGTPEDRELIAKFDGADVFPLGSEVQTSEGEAGHVSSVDPDTGVVTISAGPAPAKETHPDYCEKGIELPLGFHAHQGENRRTRRAAVANWAPPKQDHGGDPRAALNGLVESGVQPPPMPTRRELLKQRQRQRRGKLDIETRRLQRERMR